MHELIDEFAKAIVTGIVSKYTINSPEDQEIIAKITWEIAEAMMQERKRYV